MKNKIDTSEYKMDLIYPTPDGRGNISHKVSSQNKKGNEKCG